MLKHIVIWKFREFADGALRTQNLHHAKTLFEALPAKIPQIRKLEVGSSIEHSEQSYDFVLISEFKDREALKEYQAHPEHVKVVDFLGRVQAGKAVIDIETDD